MAILINIGKKHLFLSMTVGSLLSATMTQASWPQARCVAQCNILDLGKKATDKATEKGILSSERKDNISNSYAKRLNDCAQNCDNTKIADVLFSGRESLSPDNLKKFHKDLQDAKESKQKELKNVQDQLESESAKKPSSKFQAFKSALSQKNKDLKKKQEKLTSEITALKNQVTQLEKKDVPGKIAHPEGQDFLEPTIPEIEGFVDDPATTATKKDQTGKDQVSLTKWGIVKILQATGVIVKKDPQGETVKVPDIKDKTKMARVPKPLGKEDAAKIITNNPEPKQGGFYSEAVYFVDVNPRYLVAGRAQTRYVLKKNRWAGSMVKKRTENTPAKELTDLKKVRAYIVPKLSSARYAKIATIGESVFYFDTPQNSERKGEKQYFVVLEAADGVALEELFNQRDGNKTKWHEIMFNAGRATGELHRLLSDPEPSYAPLRNLDNIKTIPHGDMHMGNMFYNEKDTSITFIDTGSMADSLRSKGSPTIDLKRIFGVMKYLRFADFNGVNEDFIPFAKGYAEGFAQDVKKSGIIEPLVTNYFKSLSDDFCKDIAARALNLQNSQPQNEYVGYSLGFINNFSQEHRSYLFWDLARKVFLDHYVSQSVKRQLAQPLMSHGIITEQVANATLANP